MGTGTGTPLSTTNTTLTTLRNRIEVLLSDTTNTRFDTNTIDEGISLALAHYTREIPHLNLGEITLTSDGREIDVSSLTYINIIRVWSDYDSSDPTHPPEWRAFEEWPNDIIYVNDGDEPATGDVVRLWYTTAHTLNGLSAESVTTFPSHHETYLVTGAAGYAAIARAIDRTEKLNIDGWTHKRLADWGNELLRQYTTALKMITSQAGTRASGIVASPPLDRWDTGNGW